MDNSIIRVLSIEDDLADAMLIQDRLAEAQRIGWDLPSFEVQRVSRLEEALTHLEDEVFDVVLSDLDLPDSRADETITSLRKHAPCLPIVVLTGREDETLAHKSIRAGVQDYLYKNEVTGSLLARTMMYAIDRQANKQALQEARDALEQRVEDRTTELRQLNERLRAEIIEHKRTEKALRKSESRVRLKLKNVLSPEGDLGKLELSDIIDVDAIQSLMDDFYALTNIGIAIVDLKGNVLVSTGWQTICTQFHRVHPETRQHCIESDTILSSGVEPGDYKLYKCKNNMWDMATPIMVGGRHVGNLFLGQFFFADEDIDREMFRQQARTYGFDEEAYLDALDQVPRWSREKVTTVFHFYTEFAMMISKLSHSNLKLAQALAEKDRLLIERKKSEQKLKSYIANAPYGIFVINAEGRYVEVNEAACRLTGYEREELLSMHMVQLVPPDYRDAVKEHLQIAIEEGRAVSEKPFVTKDGSLRWWSVTTVRLSESRFLGYKKDITKRKHAEDTRRLNRYRLKALLDLSQMREASLGQIADFVLEKAVCLTKSEIGFLGFMSENEKEMIIHAWSEDTMPQCHVKDAPRHFPIEDAGVWAEAIRQNRPLILNDYAASHPGKKGYPIGHISLTRLLSVPISNGECIEAVAAVANKKTGYDEVDLRQVRLLVQGMLRLIHEREAQQALRESEERYRSLYRSIRDAILVANTDREIVNCNPAFTDLFGYTLEEIRGKKTRILYENEKGFTKVGKVLTSSRVDPKFLVTVSFRKKSGEIFPGETNLFYLRDDAGEMQGFIGLIRDITSRRQAEEKIASYAAELERSNRELQQFAYAVSHDLQEPLRVSKSYLCLLEEHYEEQLDARAQKYISRAVSSAERMKAMIKALLSLSRVGTQGEPFAPTDCERVLRYVLDDLSLTIGESGAQVTHDPLPTVMADEAQLAQVFQNLIANGIKFHRENVPPRVHVSAEQSDGAWVFSVADNGIGVAPEQTDRIFEVFQRLHTQEEYPGLGMGLALCKRILKRHSGCIWVESTPGDGSTFYFTLPEKLESATLSGGPTGVKTSTPQGA